jgi:hypothetical protein
LLIRAEYPFNIKGCLKEKNPMKKKVMFLAVVVLVMSACAAPVTADLNQTEVDLAPTEGVDDLAISTETVPDESEVSAPVAAEEYGPGEETHQATIAALSDTELSTIELEGIAFMREEEKLARDVYIQLADLWNMNIFSNISRSEDTHMEAVKTLIDLFGFEDPVQDNEVGVFTDPILQDLHDELMVSGSISLANALLVGGAIEEIDILDLQKYLNETSNSAVIEVYENLLRGSINHLNSFVRNYERQTGETYQPQFLTQEEYLELISLGSGSNSAGRSGANSSPKGMGRAGQ